MPIEGNFNVGVPSVYVGPADVVASPTYYWALRAMSAAIAAAGTQKLVNLRRDSDNATVDVLVASNGGFGLTANGVGAGGINGITVSAFKGSANLFVTIVYDQGVNANYVHQTTAANQPGLNLAGIGSLPAVTFAKASSQYLLGSAGVGTAYAQPFTSSGVGSYTNNSAQSPLFAVQGGTIQLAFDLSGSNANTAFIYAGTTGANASAADGNPHALNGVFNGASSALNVDGTDTTGLNVGSNTILSADSMNIGTDDRSTNFHNGLSMEVGLWLLTAFTGTQRSNMASNQRGYWGF